jgi:hypothetical protein
MFTIRWEFVGRDIWTTSDGLFVSNSLTEERRLHSCGCFFGRDIYIIDLKLVQLERDVYIHVDIF